MGTTTVDRVLAFGCFGLASIAGMVGAFVGLDTHGLWFDELFTARLLEPDGTGLLARIATDVHPPVYLVVLSLYSTIVGSGDAALRSLSAAAACAAIVTFVLGTRRSFSLAGRLFAAALATGSLFWFLQSQNARSYTLCLLIGAGILALALRLLAESDGRKERLLMLGLAAMTLVGSFTHFYVMYESLAALLVLAALKRRRRYVFLALAGSLLLVSTVYVKLVIEPFTQVSLQSNWYRSDPLWYFHVLKSSALYTYGDNGLAALSLCVAIVLFNALASRIKAPVALEPATALLVGVPVLVLLGGVASSTLIAPNFFDRNFLVVSPFLWGLSARLYDAATAPASRFVRTALTAALGLLALSAATIVSLRLPSDRAPSVYEPFRESAEWIRSLPACRDQIVPVISTDRRDWYKPGYAEAIYASAYGRYLQGFARPQLVFREDIRAQRLPPALKAELQRRAAGMSCPLVAWSAHNMTEQTWASVQQELAAAMASPTGVALPMSTRKFHGGSIGYTLYVGL